MLYALYVGFVSVFTAIAALGHALLLVAVYPNLFGTPQSDIAEIEFAPRERAAPQKSGLAA
jgi:hypothetical protein